MAERRTRKRSCECGECAKCKNREREYRRRNGLPPVYPTRICAADNCDVEFLAKRGDKVYCSKACRNRMVNKVYRERHSDTLLEYKREWRKENPDRQSEYFARWYYDRGQEVRAQYKRKNREKVNAHTAVLRAIEAGTLERCPCEVCGAFEVDAHHEDYARPLEVRWLCRQHHVAIHSVERQLCPSE